VGDRRTALGQRGEEAAARWYENNGYRVIARNWRCAQGEIDLLCARVDPAGRTTLVVCEVKARTSSSHGHPLEAVTSAKQARLRRLATVFLRNQDVRNQDVRYDLVRFDVVAVIGQALHVVEGAF
jgi:putative endonuclease